jgi:uncharacterized repeat protein (TIGR01451 family)
MEHFSRREFSTFEVRGMSSPSKMRASCARSKAAARRRAFPFVERLEDRVALAAYTVNDPGDDPVKDVNDHSALTAAGTITLRSAIQQCNADQGGSIFFDAPLSIHPGSDLPALATPITIDGALGVDIQGGNSLDVGLVVGSGCTVKGLIIDGFTAAAITFFGNESGAVEASGILIENNYLGTNRAGTAAAGTQGAGIDVLSKSVSASMIEDNVISGNGYGIRLVGSNNQITGNMIGTDKTGTMPIGNRIGIDLDNGQQNQLTNNVIGDNFDGIYIDNAHDNTIKQSFIGTDRGGTIDLGNQEDGIIIVHGGNNMIGGSDKSDGNTIAYNGHGVSNPSGNGVKIRYSSGNSILSNLMYHNANRGIAIYDNISQSWDMGDGDNGPNGLQNAPYVDQATSSGYVWVLRGKPGATYHIQIFQASGDEEAGSARDLLYDFPSVTADSSGNATVETANGAFMTATATDSSGNTSEFGYSDTDGDGLYDPWEKHGIDWDLDGDIDLDLSSMGANYLHKDVFVEADAMAGYGPKPMANAYEQSFIKSIPSGVTPTGTCLDAVISAFGASPVSNPDGATGINLHITVDASLPVQSPITWADFYKIKDNNIGTPADRQQQDWNAIKNSIELAFRYALFANTAGGTGDYGVSENAGTGQRPYLGPGKFLGGNDIQILVGAMQASHFDNPLNEAVCFMHELGHSLGLGHGGEDDINFKPNYHSIMNYTWALANPESPTVDPRIKASFRLDYSHGGLNTISEISVNEAAGIGGTPGNYVDVKTTSDGVHYKDVIVPESGWADFNGNGKRDSPYPLIISDPGLHGALLDTFFVLNDYNDWNNLVYNFRDAPDFATEQLAGPTDDNGGFQVDPKNVYVPPGSADVSVTQSASPGTATIGHNVAFTLTITNNGPNQSDGVIVTDTLPAGVTLVSAAPSQGTFAETPQGVIVFSVGSIANSAHATITISLTPNGPGTVTNRALVTADTIDPNLADNTSSQDATITQNLTVVPPAGASIQEGQAYTGSFGFTDKGAGPWSATIVYGDGSAIVSLPYSTPQASVSLSHVYSQPGSYYLTVAVKNTATGQAVAESVIVTVANVTPKVTLVDATPSLTINAGQEHSFQLTTTDADSRFIYRIDWGEGAGPEEFVSDSSYLASHTFAAAGTYTIKAVAIDPYGATSNEADLTVTVNPPIPIYYPTPAEQEFLERLNDARANPTAYGKTIGVDLSSFAPVMPEAFDLHLMQAAQLHSEDMYNRSYFSHYTPEGLSPSDRAAAAGFVGLVYESISLGVTDPAQILALYVIDAGVPGAGHRIQMIGVDHRQAGVGIYNDLSTIDTGLNLNETQPFLTGSVFNDTNRNGLYDAGEGLGGVTITVEGVGSTTTWSSGGYNIRVNPGTYTVIASGGGLPAPITRTVTFHYSDTWGLWENQRIDFVETPAPGSLPNDLTAPAGAGDHHAITASETLDYAVQFTDTQSGNPDQEVQVSMALDPNLDSSTFQFGNIQIGSTVVQVPAGLQTYSTVVSLTPSNGPALNVKITASLDSSGNANWDFQSIDPTTGSPPTDPTVGFLHYLDSGDVAWSVRPKSGLASGTRITAAADIAFIPSGGYYSVASPTPFNTIDSAPPSSSVQPLSATTDQTSLTVSWSGSDDAGGSGIDHYDVYVSDNSGPFMPFVTDTSQTSATFTGQVGHTYGFYSVATDLVGNRQAIPGSAQATTLLVAPAPAVIQFQGSTFKANVTSGAGQVTISRSGNLSAAVTIDLSSPGGRGVAAFKRTVTIAANATSQVVSIPITNDGKPGESDASIALSLDSPGTGASLGSSKTATLIVHDDNLPPAVTVRSLKIETVKIGKGRGAKSTAAIVLQFSGALGAVAAKNRDAYSIWTAGPDKKLGTKDDLRIGIASAEYNAAASVVTLIPATTLNLKQPELLRITASLLRDAYGRPLDGNRDGVPGGNFSAVFK